MNLWKLGSYTSKSQYWGKLELIRQSRQCFLLHVYKDEDLKLENIQRKAEEVIKGFIKSHHKNAKRYELG